MATTRRRDERARSQARSSAAPGRARLQKLLAATGIDSRRRCEDLIRQGRVTVNGELAQIGGTADPAVDEVALDGEALIFEQPVYWVLNKPTGVVTTLRDPEGRRTVAQLLPPGLARVFPVGRLDVETEGLVLLTNDGDVTQALLHPSHGNEREYDVVVRGELDGRAQNRLRRGVRLEDGRTGPMDVDKIRFDPDASTTRFRLVLREGRKRQIRRALLRLGHPVKRLRRVRMGPIRLGRLARGAARPLGDDEVTALREHCRRLRRRGPARTRKPRSAGAGR